MKLISWNVNGIRAVAKKGLIEILQNMEADVICFQETKATVEQVKEVLFEMGGYEIYANESKAKKGYSGTGIITKKTPLKVWSDMGIEEHDQEGRVINMEFEDFILVNTYVPNAQAAFARLEYRQKWDANLLNHIKNLEKQKPVILTGDLNVCHRDIDLARPKPNYNKSPGYSQAEIDGMDNYHAAGFKDTFRMLHPEEVKYSWWSYRGGAREKNVGWRIDYFLASEGIQPKVKEAFIMNDVHGSDHCPVGVTLG